MRIGPYLYAPEGSDEPPDNPPTAESAVQPGAIAIRNLGCANGWGKDPDIVVRCNALKHRTESMEEARCLTRVTCRTCGYSYTYDSSD